MRIPRALRLYGLAVAGVVGAGMLLGAAVAHADCTPDNNLVAPHTRGSWSQGGVVYDITTDELKTCDGTNYTTVSGGGTSDRIVSSTTSAIANSAGNISFTNAGNSYSYMDTNGMLRSTKTHNGSLVHQITNDSSATNAYAGMWMRNSTSVAAFGIGGVSYSTIPLLANRGFIDANSALDGIALNNEGADPIVFGTSSTERMRIHSDGKVGIGTIAPSATLHVSGTIRIANGSEACDANRAGAIRYTSGGQFQVCYGSGGWALLSSADISGTLGSTPDRIVSGSHSVIANTNTGYVSLTNGSTVYGYLGQSATYLPVLNVAAISATTNQASFTALYASGNMNISGSVYIGNSSTNTERNINIYNNGSYAQIRYVNGSQLVINQDSSATSSLIDINPLVSNQTGIAKVRLFRNTSTTATTGLELMRGNGSVITDYYFYSGADARSYLIVNGGRVGIGTIAPAASLTVVGEVQVSNSGVTCSSTTQGAIRYTSGNLQYCNGSSFTALSSNTTAVSALGDLSDAATEYTTSYTFFVGSNAGVSSKGDYVTGVGQNAAYLNNGNNVVGLGMSAAYQSSGSYVTAAGYAAAAYNSGTHVTGVGYNAARQNTVNYVTGVGHAAAYLNTGMYVTGLGYFAAYQNTGAGVTALGHSAASQNTGNYVTGVGVNAAYQNTAANVVAIGYEAGKNNTVANQFIVKQSTVNATPLIQGNFSTGYVGIGTTSPTSTLHVAGQVAATSVSLTQGLYYMDTGAVEFTIGSSAATTIPLTLSHPSVNWRTYIHNTDSVKYKIAYNNTGSYTDVMTFTTAGLVGVGTNNPSVTLHVSGSTYLDGTVRIRSTSSLATAHLDLDPSLDVTSLNPGTSTTGSMIRSQIYGHMLLDLRNNGADDAIAFRRSAANNGTVDTIGMVFRGDGHVGIGTISPTARLDVVSSTAGVAVARFQNGTGACTFTPASSGSGTWSCSSDARLKTDITDAEGRALDWVRDFRIRDYTVKADGSRQTGVIAQEVANTHPEMVHTGADGMMTVDEPGIWKLVQAIQELKAQNDEMKARSDRMEAANDNLRRDLDALKRSLGR